MFLTLNHQGKTIVMITHDLEYLIYGSKIFHMVDGQVIEEYKRENGRKAQSNIKGKRYTGNEKKAELNIRDPNFLKKIKI